MLGYKSKITNKLHIGRTLLCISCGAVSADITNAYSPNSTRAHTSSWCHY